MAEIWHDEAAGAWLAEMRSTAYAFGLADGGAALRHLHWGAPLPREALRDLLAAATGPLPRHEQQLSMTPHERPDEYVPWGGLRFDEPSLKAEFGDGTRGVEWRFAGHRVTRQGRPSTLEVDLADTAYPLRVTLAYRVYDGFDVLDRWATLRHDGDAGGPPVISARPTPRTGSCRRAAAGGCATCTAAGAQRASSSRPRSPRARSSWRAAAAPPATSSIPGSRSTRTAPPRRKPVNCGAAPSPGAAHGSSSSRPRQAATSMPAAA